jgi:hypothetical protein
MHGDNSVKFCGYFEVWNSFNTSCFEYESYVCNMKLVDHIQRVFEYWAIQNRKFLRII